MEQEDSCTHQRDPPISVERQTWEESTETDLSTAWWGEFPGDPAASSWGSFLQPGLAGTIPDVLGVQSLSTAP